MRVTVDQNTCIGCGLCVGTAGDVFRLNGDGVAECYAEPSESLRDLVQQAADNCPVGAIKILD